MRTLDATTWHILLAIADDWESIVQIQQTLGRFGFSVPDEVVYQTLRELHDDGSIHIMAPDGYAVARFPTDPSEYWFYWTPRGERLFCSGEAQFRRPDPET